ncbi:MAG TPA: hypothetical protein VEA78_12095 [Acidimicrobiales bacterium]|nr:hypothetical protein [Acidimicrobiales bacterium]
MSVTPEGRIVVDDGAELFGDLEGGAVLNAPVVGLTLHWTRANGSAWLPTGYWFVGADGGVFAFGSARFLGAMAGRPMNAPVVAMVPTPSGNGYWLVGSDGGVFCFGDATFHGSGAATGRTFAGMEPTTTGRGYRLVAADGDELPYGDAS